MKADEVRELSSDELNERIGQNQEELFRLRPVSTQSARTRVERRRASRPAGSQVLRDNPVSRYPFDSTPAVRRSRPDSPVRSR